jgi:tRNA (adenine57-N1/adenine58-N1)-methyltransferase
VHRTEPEVKTHTSYLVFAVLPQEWTAEDEAKAREKWEVLIRTEEDKADGEGEMAMSKRQMKRAARQAQKEKAAEIGPEAVKVEDTPAVDDMEVKE